MAASDGLSTLVRRFFVRLTGQGDFARKAVLSCFDLDFYNRQLPTPIADINKAVRHYLTTGWQQSLDPSPTFSTMGYLERYPDVAQSHVPPLVHYLRHGPSEGRVAWRSGVMDASEAGSVEITQNLRDYFDINFYRNQTGRYFTGDDAIRHYFGVGCSQGLDPSPAFSGRDYAVDYPEAVEAGTNPLVHYLLVGREAGYRVRGSASLFDADISYPTAEDAAAILELFDSNFYNLQVERAFSATDGARHYLGKGWKAGLDPSRAFSTRAYLDNNADVVAAQMNPLLHYLVHGRPAGRHAYPSNLFLDVNLDRKLPDASEMSQIIDRFSLAHYNSQVSEAYLTVEEAVRHYIEDGWRQGLDPTPDFSTEDYLAQYPDIRDAEMAPYWHFVVAGEAEGRKPKGAARRLFNSRKNDRDVLRDIMHKVVDGVHEWEDYGYVSEIGQQTLESRAPDLDAIAFTVDYANTDLIGELSNIDFSRCATAATKNVDISIIIPTINESQVLLECLASISRVASDDLMLEIVVADNASTDPLYSHLAAHNHIQYVRFETNIGFGNACNAAAAASRGTYLFFLNNDAQVAPDCLEQLFKSHKTRKAGITGPKILSFDGRLQEAGCVLKGDGTGSLIGYAYNPSVPRFNYARKVDHVSGAAILISRTLFDSVGGFDPVYAPAYCEDADLSLKIRAAGHDIYYEPKGVVVHHLSKTSNELNDKARSKRQRISRNRQTLVSRWNEQLATTRLRTIAFYLPQYHPIPENDLWWGKGFTEWTNIGRAKPNFEGHLQPRTPADLGYYDLRLPEIMEQQVDLARRYGLSGFCYYYYNFDGKRILELPLENMLRTGRPDFPFCLCWANENWTKRWDGESKGVLLAQSYSDANSVKIAKDMLRYCRLKNYIRVDGKPLILIYRVSELPNAKRFIAQWRKAAKQEGIGDIMIASVESFHLSSKPEDPAAFGCDITVEFPPHDMVNSPPLNVTKTNAEWTGSAHDYRELAAAYMTRVDPGFKRLRSVLVGWDNTPRYRERSLVLEKASPGAFQAWLEWTLQRTLEQNYGDERLVFINAWNEWCEGSYLEPDQHFGHAYLQALKNAVSNVETGGGKFAVSV